MLIAGLQPQGSFSNDWLRFVNESSATRFEGFGLAHGRLSEPVASSTGEAFLVQLTLTPELPDNDRFSIIAQLDSGDGAASLIIGQWRDRLITINGTDFTGAEGLPRAAINMHERLGHSVQIKIAYRSNETLMWRNKELISNGPGFYFDMPLTRLTVGNSPGGRHGWVGEIERLAIATNEGQDTDNYAFDQDQLPFIANTVNADHPLLTPAPGDFPERRRIERVSLDILINENQRDLWINLVGFAPFGFLVCALLVWPPRRTPLAAAWLLTVIAGLAFSVFIEHTQTRLPGRNPHVHDVVMNALGTAAGAVLYCALQAITRLVTR